MIKTTYKRKGRRYACHTKPNSQGIKKIFYLLDRFSCSQTIGFISEFSFGLLVRAFNAVGVLDVAVFKHEEIDLAKSFIYSTTRKKSPQLSLFFGGI